MGKNNSKNKKASSKVKVKVKVCSKDNGASGKTSNAKSCHKFELQVSQESNNGKKKKSTKMVAVDKSDRKPKMMIDKSDPTNVIGDTKAEHMDWTEENFLILFICVNHKDKDNALIWETVFKEPIKELVKWACKEFSPN